jgi:6,7-dimethyl-8-ribityllumazine synthase
VATQEKSNNQVVPVPPAGNSRFGIVVAEWNTRVTEALYDGAKNTLLANGASKENIIKHYVPGSFELPLGAQFMANSKKVDAVICLGCIVQGETRHFEFIANSVADGVTQVGLKYDMPVIFGVLTPDNEQQALDRAGGKYGNKGEEAAIAALKMLAMKKDLDG